jgi:two-component system NarL family sensor kinase
MAMHATDGEARMTENVADQGTAGASARRDPSASPASVRRRTNRDHRPPSTRRAVGQFVLSGLGALALVAIAGVIAVDRLSTAASLRDGGRVAELVAHGVVEPAMSGSLVRGDPGAIAALDRVVRDKVLLGSLARIKIWTPEGRIIYSDEPQLIGSVFPLAADQTEALASGVTGEPHISDLTAPENRLESSDDRLIEVYVPIRALDGTPLLVESYLRFDSVFTSGRLVAEQILPLILAGLALLVIVQWPLAMRLTRDLRAGHQARERLLQRAADSSQEERRRIAGELHDGLVQSLAGVALDLAGSADRANDPTAAADLERGAEGVRGAMREARSLLVELYPPNLRTAGLANAVTDLGAKVSARGIEVRTRIEDDGSLSDVDQAVVYRVAQEALRNVVKHSRARHADIAMDVTGGGCELTIADDGVGFDPAAARTGPEAGHLGLTVLRDLARDAGAALDIRRNDPDGTVVAFRLPAPA